MGLVALSASLHGILLLWIGDAGVATTRLTDKRLPTPSLLLEIVPVQNSEAAMASVRADPAVARVGEQSGVREPEQSATPIPAAQLQPAPEDPALARRALSEPTAPDLVGDAKESSQAVEDRGRRLRLDRTADLPYDTPKPWTDPVLDELADELSDSVFNPAKRREIASTQRNQRVRSIQSELRELRTGVAYDGYDPNGPQNASKVGDHCYSQDAVWGIWTRRRCRGMDNDTARRSLKRELADLDGR